MKTLWMFFCILLIALITAMFAVINLAPVPVHLVFFDAEVPLIVIILSSTLLGGLIVGLIGMIKQFRMRRTIRQLERQLADLQRDQAAAPIDMTSGAEAIGTVPVHPVHDEALYPNL